MCDPELDEFQSREPSGARDVKLILEEEHNLREAKLHLDSRAYFSSHFLLAIPSSQKKR